MAEKNSNIASIFFEKAELLKEKEFLFYPSKNISFTYKEMDNLIRVRASLLRKNGIKKGDCVNILLPNCPDFIISFLSILSIGAVANPINTGLKADSIFYIINHSEAKMLITSSLHTKIIDEMKPALEKRNYMVFSIDENSKYQSINEESRNLSPIKYAEITEDNDTAILIYTSGTTGTPKGVMLTHGNLRANAEDISSWLKLSEDDRLMCIMPYFHLNGIMITLIVPFFIGASLVLKEKFSASQFWEDVSNYSVTAFGSVATMLNILNRRFDKKNFKYNVSSLKYALCGSAPVPVEVIRSFEKNFNVPVIEGYGLTESTCRATFNPVDGKRKPGSAGLPLSNKIEIVDEKGNILPPGEKGEIIIKGKNIMKGYFKDPEKTAKAIRNGWLYSGDIGWKDSEGYIYITDRKDDLIIKGGENIYPREIDEALYNIEAVAEAATIGIPDDIYGEEIKSFVKLKNGYSISENELLSLLKEKLDNFRCPKEIEIVDSIPKGPTGKLLKRALKYNS